MNAEAFLTKYLSEMKLHNLDIACVNNAKKIQHTKFNPHSR